MSRRSFSKSLTGLDRRGSRGQWTPSFQFVASLPMHLACSNFLYGSNSPFSHLTKLNSAHPLAVTLVVTQSPHLLAHLSILRSAVIRRPRCPESAENKSNLYKHLHKQDAAIFYTQSMMLAQS